MKRIAFSLLLLFYMSEGAFAQWDSTGAGIYSYAYQREVMRWFPTKTSVYSGDSTLRKSIDSIKASLGTMISTALGFTPTAQVQTDWNAVSGMGVLLNKPKSVVTYNSSGVVAQNLKIWTASGITPSTGNGYSIDISSAGFTTVLSVSVIATRNSANAYQSPNVSIKSKSATAIVVNIVEDNAAALVAVALIGLNVLSGYPSVFANVTGLTLDVTVVGY